MSDQNKTIQSILEKYYKDPEYIKVMEMAFSDIVLLGKVSLTVKNKIDTIIKRIAKEDDV